MTARMEPIARRPLLDRLPLRFPWIAPLYVRIALHLAHGPLRRPIAMDFLRRSARALNRHDLDVYLLGFHPEVEWRVSADLPEAGVHRGLGAVRRYLADYFEPWDDWQNRPLEVIGLNRRRIAFTSQLSARGEVSGITVEQNEAYVIELERGWIVRLHEFRSADLARAAFEARDPATVG